MKELLTKFADNSIGSPIIPPGSEEEDLLGNIQTILSAIIGILGFVCVVVMIIGGVNYMTSTGDAGKVKKAKDTILYGLIGLIVCALAFALVQFVINVILGGSSS